MSDNVCQECRMMVEPGEYHPYPACVMFRQTGSSEKVRDFLKQVINHGAEEAHYRYTALRVAVVSMRDAQKNYFRSRDQKWLNQSKALEARVDKLLEGK